jgi:putative transposase
LKTYKFKLYNSKKNKNLDEVISLSGRAYNFSIAMSKTYYKLFGKTLKHTRLQKHMTKKKDVFDLNLERTYKRFENGEISAVQFDQIANRLYWKSGYMKDIPSQALQQVTERVRNSYKLYFENRKRGKKSSPPGFKSSRRYSSFTLKQAGWKYSETEKVPQSLANKTNFKQNKITIDGIKYKFHKTQSVDGEIKTVNIKRDHRGGFYICFCAELTQEPVMTGIDFKSCKKAKAIDFGLKDFLVFDDGCKVSSPEFLKSSIKELRVLYRKHSKKVNGSKNRELSRMQVSRLQEHIANQRLNWARKTAHAICRSFEGVHGNIFIEDLNLQGMKGLWGRKVSDIAYGQFVEELTRIASTYGIEVLKIGMFDRTTGVCAETGFIKKLELSDRHWNCECGSTHDRDVESAKVILKVGLGLRNNVARETARRPARESRQAARSKDRSPKNPLPLGMGS